ncbi:hypothetical protein Sta7437_1465 [Stanieria cyanosphaera PCC 7437]|uniref:Uncharacterized protein n=1 Tax=Stanieria cyanosphaera (strain ATCC 29371 / PCC 7437) TaxID=111780 RepID=K9XTP0_STAC7|nr:haloacid dehalogenase-like hydrolase [Stanieria cyanosphaera]AFZ35032.1 hypothetical protein Sta7437_1465 [Stanieria cyanosphaera PCC 7437]
MGEPLNIVVNNQVGCYKPNSPTTTIEAIKTASKDTPIIIDFDETLLLRNSTAEYLNSLQPRLIGALLLRIFNYFQPWNWLPSSIRGKDSRDWFLIIGTTLLLPWTLLLWQKKAKQLAKDFSNNEIISALNQNNQADVVVATLGFNLIVIPILKHIPINYSQIVTCRFWRGAIDRHKGKLQMVIDALGVEAVESSLVVTDSSDDIPLLAKVAQPYYVIWSQAKYTVPMNDLYLPFFYLEKVKRPGQKYLFKAILGEDLWIIWLSYSWLSSQRLIHALSMLLLLISFWCIYEVGYWENDLVAEKYEEKPVLSESYYNYQQISNVWQPWLWSFCFAVFGIIFLVASQNNFVTANLSLENGKILALPLIKWISFLAVVRGYFWIYNYVNKRTRIWLYLPLQIYRYFGYLLITPINLVGTILLVTQVLTRYMPYALYRYGGGKMENWSQLPKRLFCFLIFVFILSALTVGSGDISLLLNQQSLAILLWCFLQAGYRMWQEIRQIKPIYSDGTNQVTES